MNRSDIITIPITSQMIKEAKNEADYLNASKTGQKTRPTIQNANIYGSLAHQAIEAVFEDAGLQYTSYRKEKYTYGDQYDIQYEKDHIDVKGTHGIIDRWFFNRQFLVFQKQIDDPKFKQTTHLAFVVIEPNPTNAHIFGIIPTELFMEKSSSVVLRYENRGIRAHELQSFRNYMFRN